MPRTSSKVLAGKNAAITKQSAQITNITDKQLIEKNIVTAEKIKLINLPVEDIIIAASKGSGKTGPVVVKAEMSMVNDADADVLALRKLMKGSKQKLVRTFIRTKRRLQSAGFRVPEIRPSEIGAVVVRNYKDMTNNQLFQTSSFENIEDIQGIEPAKGYFSYVICDELVPKPRKNELYEPVLKEAWEGDIKTIKSSVNRWTRVYREEHPDKSIADTKYFFMFNPFVDHPEYDNLERVYPEKEWIEWVTSARGILSAKPEEIIKNKDHILRSIQKNHTGWKVAKMENSGKGRAYARMTTWANPIERTPELLESMFNALLTKNNEDLTILFGLKYNAPTAGVPTYDFDNVKYKRFKDYLEEGYIPVGLSTGADIDISRKLVTTPAILLRKINKFTREIEDEKLHIYNPSVLITNKKLREKGLHSSETYKTWVARNGEKDFRELTPSLRNYRFMMVDDNQEAYIDPIQRELLRNNVRTVVYKAVKKGEESHWDILHRQDWMQLALDEEFITFEPETKDNIVQEFIMSIRKPGEKKRNEKSTKEKHYDYINTVEYAVYPFWERLYANIKTRKD